MGKYLDLTGLQFGRLFVLKRHHLNDKHNKPTWECQCSCGNKKVVAGQSLRTHATRSCGCLSKEVAKLQSKISFTTHGDTGSHEYRVWLSMKSRIKRPNKPTYEKIDICNRWSNSYLNFLEDMGRAPSSKHQLDRIDNAIGYYPDNCRWVTRKENCRNKTDNLLIEWEGQTKCLYEWAEMICPTLGICPDTLQYRVKKWGVEKAFTTPKKANQFG